MKPKKNSRVLSIFYKKLLTRKQYIHTLILKHVAEILKHVEGRVPSKLHIKPKICAYVYGEKLA